MIKLFARSLAVTALLISPVAASSGEAKHKGHDAHESDADPSCTLPMGEGVIHSIDVNASKLNLTHKPIASLGWGEMTMDFTVEKIVDLSAFYEGEKIHFMLSPSSKSHSIAMICSLEIGESALQACLERMGREQVRIMSKIDPRCADAADAAAGHLNHH